MGGVYMKNKAIIAAIRSIAILMVIFYAIFYLLFSLRNLLYLPLFAGNITIQKGQQRILLTFLYCSNMNNATGNLIPFTLQTLLPF